MSHPELIQSLINQGFLKTPLLIDAFKAIDRKFFVRPDDEASAYINAPLLIGSGQTISQPLTVAFMLERFQPKPQEKIMDVGAGSGWQTALLAYVVGDKGKVCAIERIPDLCDFGKANVAKFNFIEHGVVKWFCQNATEGFLNEAPFDGIVVGAELKDLPATWVTQLKDGGRILAPMDSAIVLWKKESGILQKMMKWEGFSFVPFIYEVQKS